MTIPRFTLSPFGVGRFVGAGAVIRHALFIICHDSRLSFGELIHHFLFLASASLTIFLVISLKSHRLLLIWLRNKKTNEDIGGKTPAGIIYLCLLDPKPYEQQDTTS
jgi:hypothetical protein